MLHDCIGQNPKLGAAHCSELGILYSIWGADGPECWPVSQVRGECKTALGAGSVILVPSAVCAVVGSVSGRLVGLFDRSGQPRLVCRSLVNLG